jgi:hypothetical protein
MPPLPSLALYHEDTKLTKDTKKCFVFNSTPTNVDPANNCLSVLRVLRELRVFVVNHHRIFNENGNSLDLCASVVN